MLSAPLPPELVAILRCPACFATGLTSDGDDRLLCGGCHRHYERTGGILDLAPAESPARSLAQRLMERRAFARIYERYWRPVVLRALGSPGRAAEELLFKRALAIGDRPGPWLDLSCGPGNVARALTHAAGGDLVIGLDLSRPMLEQAAASLPLLPTLKLVRGDAQSLPFADASLGGCVNSLALHLYPDLDRVLLELARVLRPGAAFAALTLGDSGLPIADEGLRAIGLAVVSEHDLRARLARAGFVGYDSSRRGAVLLFCCRKP